MAICPLGDDLIYADGRTNVQTDRQTGVQVDEGNEANRRFARPFKRAQILYIWQKLVELSSKNCCCWSVPRGPLE